MAHAGKEVIFRPVQLLDLLFLPLREGIFLLIHFVEEHKQHAGHQPHHDHGKSGVQKGVILCIEGHELREIQRKAVAEDGLHRAENEKHSHTPSLQGDADVDKAEDKPLRHAAVKSPCGKKADGEHDEQQDRDSRCACADPLHMNACLHNQRHSGKAYRQYQKIPYTPAHRQDTYQRDHAGACHNAEHPLPQADAVVRDDIKPFFNHTGFHLSNTDFSYFFLKE